MKSEFNQIFEINNISEKSKSVMKDFLADKTRLTLMEGAIRSGKTVSATLLLVLKILTLKDSLSQGRIYDCLLGAHSLSTIHRNILQPMTGILNYYGVPFQYNGQYNYIQIANLRFHCVGFTNITTNKVILGSTLLLVYLDEVNFCQRDAFDVILDRTSYKDSKILMSMNPQSEAHWIYEDYVDNDRIDINHYTYTLADNNHLDTDYVSWLKSRYPEGSNDYNTKILGLRGANETSIYGPYLRDSFFVENDRLDIHAQGNFSHTNEVLGLDLGFSSQTTIQHIRVYVKSKVRAKSITDSIVKYVVHDEKIFKYNEFEEGSEFTYNDIADYISNYVAGKYTNLGVRCIVCVPHDGTALYNQLLPLRKNYKTVIELIKPDTLQAIEKVKDLMRDNKLVISRDCADLKKSLYDYSYKVNSVGEYVVDKASNDHGADALRLPLEFEKLTGKLTQTQNYSRNNEEFEVYDRKF